MDLAGPWSLAGTEPSIRQGGHRGFTAGFQHAQGLDHSIAAFGCDGALACEGCPCGVLGIQIIIIATLAAIMRVRCRDLQNSTPAFCM